MAIECHESMIIISPGSTGRRRRRTVTISCKLNIDKRATQTMALCCWLLLLSELTMFHQQLRKPLIGHETETIDSYYSLATRSI